MAKVYVVNARAPRGGAYMAYHIGRIIHQNFGYEFVDVPLGNFGDAIFTYDVPMPRMTREQMEAQITADDILVCNPSAASAHMFGLRLPGKKIMYIQDFRTYGYLDCHFDVYACVSSVVQNFLQATYGITAPIIPPFIELEAMPQATPWNERPEHSALVYMKAKTSEHMHVYHWFKKQFGVYYPELQMDNLLSNYTLTHTEFLKKLGEVRYLVNISIAEGFGLVPLEAMAMETIPIGLDGLSGRDYMKFGENSFCVSYKSLRQFKFSPHHKFSLINSASLQNYSKKQFESNWLKLLTTHLQYV